MFCLGSIEEQISVSSRYYFNPFKPKAFVDELSEEEGNSKTASYCLTFDKPIQAFLTKEEVYELLELLLKTKKCFGKFDLFNKWSIGSIKVTDGNVAKQLKNRLRYVSMKVGTFCPKCEHINKCSLIRISLEELQSIWNDIYFSRGLIFNLKEEEVK